MGRRIPNRLSRGEREDEGVLFKEARGGVRRHIHDAVFKGWGETILANVTPDLNGQSLPLCLLHPSPLINLPLTPCRADRHVERRNRKSDLISFGGRSQSDCHHME